MTTDPAGTVVLLSGGLDSCVLAAMVSDLGSVVRPLFVNYGQRSAEVEEFCASEVSRELGTLPLETVRLSLGADVAACIADAPTMTLEEIRAQELAATYMPARNSILLSVAAGYAERGHRVLQVVPGERDEHRPTEWGRRVTVSSPLLPGGGGYRVIVRLRHVQRLIAGHAADVVEVSDRATLAHLATRLRGRAHKVVGFVAGERHRLPAAFPFPLAPDVFAHVYACTTMPSKK